jgi:predicted acylesterase/phospholipase RssA
MAELANANLRVRRIVGTSSGALNAAYYARAVRSGAEATAGDELARIWLEEATLGQAFNVSVRGTLDLEGISTSDNVLRLLRRYIRPSTGQREIDLRVVVTNSEGNAEDLGADRRATTFEHVLRYDGATLDTEVGLELLFEGVAASAAFPGVFLPIPLRIDGRSVPCFDGGLTNDTPVKYAVEEAADIDRLFVIAAHPALLAPTRALRGLTLGARLLEILVQERLYRDVRRAYAVNATLGRLARDVADPVARARILQAFGWSDRRKLEIVEIRPQAPLEGGPFNGFFSQRLRRSYIAAGRDAGRTWRSAAGGAP